jgi:hypothetical protein
MKLSVVVHSEVLKQSAIFSSKKMRVPAVIGCRHTETKETSLASPASIPPDGATVEGHSDIAFKNKFKGIFLRPKVASWKSRHDFCITSRFVLKSELNDFTTYRAPGSIPGATRFSEV